MNGKSIQKNTCTVFKGLFALVILMHHFTTYLYEVPVYLEWLKYIAYPVVGAFFFFSGYGLTSGIINKKNYLDGFLKKRFGKVLLPFVSIAVLSTASLSLLKHKFANAFSIRVIRPYWFIYVILAAYLIFYLIFRFLSVKKGIWAFLAVTVIYIGASIFLNPSRNEMYASVIAFPLGAVFRFYEDRIYAFYDRRFTLKFISQALLCMLLFVFRLYLAYRGIENEVLHTVLRNAVSAIFVWLTGLLLQRVSIEKRALLTLGSISYEIYIIHPVLIRLYMLFTIPYGIKEITIMIFTVAALTLLLSYLFHIVFTKILTDGGKKDVKKA